MREVYRLAPGGAATSGVIEVAIVRGNARRMWGNRPGR
jgi:hypothetical protein